MTRIFTTVLRTGALSAAFLASFTLSLSHSVEHTLHDQQFLNHHKESIFSSVPAPDAALEAWLHNQHIYAFSKILANIGPDGANARGTAPGCILASPSRYAPNYYYQWTRDGGIVIGSLVEQWQKGKWPKEEEKRILDRLLKVFIDYTDIQKRLQWTDNRSGGFYDGGLGEPKFNVDGSVFTKYVADQTLISAAL